MHCEHRQLLTRQAVAILCAALAGVANRAVAQATRPTPMTLQNEHVRVAFDAADGSFSATDASTGKTFLTRAKLLGSPATVTQAAVKDATFGDGTSVDLTAADGSVGHVSVYPGVPFVFCRVTLANRAADAVVLNRVPLGTFDVALDRPAADLATMGTGGLASVAKNPGSYAWLSVADPATRHGVVAAWLTHDRACGVLFPKADGDRVRIEARGDYGRLRLKPGATAESETLVVGYFDDARLGLETYADAVARHYAIRLPKQPTVYCTWYAEKHGQAADESSIAELAAFAAKTTKPFGHGVVQIDDYWQSGTRVGGPAKNFSTHKPNGPYPSGMKAAADAIKADGFTPGLWLIPFAGSADAYFDDKREWFLKDDQGKPYVTKWGGTLFDMTRPEAREYVHGVVRRMASEWGFRYFKFDGLYTGVGARLNYVNTGYKEDGFGDAVYADADKTNVEVYRDSVRLLRDAAGPDAFFLGCSVTQNMRMFGPSFGLFDAMRVGPDNGATWTAWMKSPQAASWNYFLNGRVWYNDPDPQYVRAVASMVKQEEPNDANGKPRPATQKAVMLSDDEARTIASWDAVSGALNSFSDWLPDLPAVRLDILRRTMPAHGKIARPVDYFENSPPRVWTVTDDRGNGDRRDIVALFNWSAADAAFDLPVDRLGLPPAAAYHAFDYWGGRFVPLTDRVKATVPKHGCLILSVRAAAGRPVLVSTSRHVTQGMTDVKDERWDAATKTLAGHSELVGSDPYELRIAGGTPTRVAVSEADAAAGVTTRLVQSADGVRVSIDTPSDRAVDWRVGFE